MTKGREQRLVFSDVVDHYDRMRPAYPEELIEEVVCFAGAKPGARVLEVGCGTGLATRSFAERGLRMVCLEPGEPMAERARRNLERFENVELRVESFEDWALEPEAFELVISAQAFHWVPYEVGFPKAARALRNAGLLAVFGHLPLPVDAPVYREIQQVYREQAPEMAVSTAHVAYVNQDSSPLLHHFRISDRFGTVETRAYEWSRSYSGHDYCALLQTYSDHQMLEEQQRLGLLAGVLNTIEAHGGSIQVDYVTRLFMAVRVD